MNPAFFSAIGLEFSVFLSMYVLRFSGYSQLISIIVFVLYLTVSLESTKKRVDNRILKDICESCFEDLYIASEISRERIIIIMLDAKLYI